MAKIKVTPEELLAVQDEMRGLITDVKRSGSELSGALSGMENSFCFGGSESAGREKILLYEKFIAGIGRLEAQIDKLSVMAENYREAERKNTDEEAADG